MESNIVLNMACVRCDDDDDDDSEGGKDDNYLHK